MCIDNIKIALRINVSYFQEDILNESQWRVTYYIYLKEYVSDLFTNKDGYKNIIIEYAHEAEEPWVA